MSSRQPRLVLASASPRRARLLEQIRLRFEIDPADVDESALPNEAPAAYVERLARLKAASVARRTGAGVVVLAADTVVVLDDEMLGKPASSASGIEMLLALSGRNHQVLTALAVTDGVRNEAHVVATRVTFVPIDRALAEAYWATGEGVDKAGCYGIQGIGGIFAQSIEGSYSAVVGLPLPETEQLLASFGIDTWAERTPGG